MAPFYDKISLGQFWRGELIAKLFRGKFNMFWSFFLLLLIDSFERKHVKIGLHTMVSFVDYFSGSLTIAELLVCTVGGNTSYSSRFRKMEIET